MIQMFRVFQIIAEHLGRNCAENLLKISMQEISREISENSFIFASFFLNISMMYFKSFYRVLN